MKLILLLFPILVLSPSDTQWGFYAHKQINRLAVFTLPPEMLGFYKYNIEYLTEESVSPDKRRYIIKDEAARHFIDLDEYDSLPPVKWQDAVAEYSKDTLQQHGVLPWHVQLLKWELTNAFRNVDKEKVLKISADLGHYLADANVPLHTTRNYNGQLTGQEGIHGFWESRLPELFMEEYDLLTGRASYLKNPAKAIWETILSANYAVDSVLLFERELSSSFPADKKYTYINRGTTTVKVYSKEYSLRYHKLLKGQVERQMRKSIKLIGDFWFTCWVDAGRPDLGTEIITPEDREEEAQEMLQHDCHGSH